MYNGRSAGIVPASLTGLLRNVGPCGKCPIRAFGTRIQRAFNGKGEGVGRQVSESFVRPSPYPHRDSIHNDQDHQGNRESNWTSRTSTRVEETHSNMATAALELSRSRSRGRDLYSTGRGGVGNMRRSLSRDTGAAYENSIVDPELASLVSRGRDSFVKTPGDADEYVVHIGRGGAGNVRSVSRARDGVSEAESKYEQSIIEHHEEHHATFSTGRGGAGNIVSPEQSPARSRSRGASVDRVGRSLAPHQGQGVVSGSPSAERSQSRGRLPHSSGRGGAGNIHVSDLSGALEEIDEEDVKKDLLAASLASQPHLHSTGRGGLANVTGLASPPLESHPHMHHGGEEIASSGRGGVGNIRDRSVSRPGHERSSSALGKLLGVVKKHHHQDG